MTIFDPCDNEEDIRAQVKDIGLYGPARLRFPWEPVPTYQPPLKPVERAMNAVIGTLAVIAAIVVTVGGR